MFHSNGVPLGIYPSNGTYMRYLPQQPGSQQVFVLATVPITLATGFLLVFYPSNRAPMWYLPQQPSSHLIFTLATVYLTLATRFLLDFYPSNGAPMWYLPQQPSSHLTYTLATGFPLGIYLSNGVPSLHLPQQRYSSPQQRVVKLFFTLATILQSDTVLATSCYFLLSLATVNITVATGFRLDIYLSNVVPTWYLPQQRHNLPQQRAPTCSLRRRRRIYTVFMSNRNKLRSTVVNRQPSNPGNRLARLRPQSVKEYGQRTPLQQIYSSPFCWRQCISVGILIKMTFFTKKNFFNMYGAFGSILRCE